ncbi:hypothetical protein [Parasitella parasitica]|uniref:Uncharacterized protein n=1 Tax=Parasitella parasitica TaxID=35722 RepID=A0A0B7MWY4_9FUNG|nr:hypothetical protein [Parasitella parasitica]
MFIFTERASRLLKAPAFGKDELLPKHAHRRCPTRLLLLASIHGPYNAKRPAASQSSADEEAQYTDVKTPTLPTDDNSSTNTALNLPWTLLSASARTRVFAIFAISRQQG